MSSLSIDRRESLNVYNSTSKLQNFFGVDDIDEIKTEIKKRSSSSLNVFNSTSKLQDFFGVDDIHELKTEINEKRSSSSNKTINNGDRIKKIKKENKKLQRGLEKLRKETSNSSKKRKSGCFICKLLKPEPIMVDAGTINVKNEKVSWRPKLAT
eukprot:556477_1